MKKTGLILSFVFTLFVASGQINDNYSDELLTSSFKIFKQADFELANHMLPFIRNRIISELNNSNSFYNSYDSLSQHITIKHSSDSLVKLYCWDERNSGCRLSSSTFVQYKTESNQIKTLDLEKLASNYDEDLYITDLQRIQINNEAHYLIIGKGGHCGNHKYEIARVYKISEDSLIKCDSIFETNNEISAGSTRSGNIKMKYSSKEKTLSYNFYKHNKNTGFYSYDIEAVRKWKLIKSGFRKIN